MRVMPRFEARIDISHRPGILDPQGANVERALPALGWDNVTEVSVGKNIRLVVEADDEATARKQIDEMCRRLLTNPVLEDYELKLRAAVPGGSP